MPPHGSSTYERVTERRRAVALARHFREAEGLSIAQIASRLGRSPATIKAYFYDPTGAKARAVKARYVGVCRGCGAYTQPRNGKGDAYAYCKACHPGAIERRWTRERVLDAMRDWRARYGRLPSSYDWSRTHAVQRGGEALVRLSAGGWPSASTVTDAFGSWDAARAAAAQPDRRTVCEYRANAIEIIERKPERAVRPISSQERGFRRDTRYLVAEDASAKTPRTIRNSAIVGGSDGFERPCDRGGSESGA